LSDGSGDGPSAGLLTASEWAALKKICQAAPQVTPQASRATPQERPGSDQRGALPRLEPSGR
jgi:hypothetical protein